MQYFMVDVESDGPIPGDYSMISIGCVLVEEPLTKTFAADPSPFRRTTSLKRWRYRE